MKNQSVLLSVGFITTLALLGPQPAEAFSFGGSATSLTSRTQSIGGSVGSNDVDFYKIFLYEGANFAVSTAAPVGGLDTQLFLFDSNGKGVFANDDILFRGSSANLNSRIPTFAVQESGDYYLAVTGYDYDPYSGGSLIFPTSPFDGVYRPTNSGLVDSFQSVSGGQGSSSGGYQLFIQQSLPVSLYFDAFIPQDKIENPQAIISSSDFFKGDNRGFEYGGSYRIRQTYLIDLLAENPKPIALSQDVGPTTGLDSNGNVVARGQAGNEGLSVEVSREGEKVESEVVATATNPLVPFAPALDYEYDLSLELAQENLLWTLTGDHDGFPAYSVYIGETLVYSHDPIKEGQSPLSLFPPKEFEVDESGTLMVSDVLRTGLGSAQQFPLLPQVAAGLFTFTDVPSGNWFDPPLASGFEYQMTGESFFTEILEFPVGVDGDGFFAISVDNILLGEFGIGESVNFVDLLGGPVSSFTLSGIDPAVDSTFGDAFPLRLAFDTPTASFTMSPIIADDSSASVPEPASAVAILSLGFGFFVVRRRKVKASI